MNFNDVSDHYWLPDGAIKSFYLDIQRQRVEVELSVRRCAKGKKQEHVTLQEPCILKLTFQEIIEVSMFDNFPTDGYYLDFCYYDNDHEVGFSLNIFDNSSQLHEKYNWVIKAKKMSWAEST